MLRLYIDGRWDCEDFAEVLGAVESLYYTAASVELEPYREFHFAEFQPRYDQSYAHYLDEANLWRLRQARLAAGPKIKLKVARIEYGSPGGIDLAGLGQATEALERLIGRLLEFFTGRRMRRERDRQAAIESEILQQNLYALKLDNARKLLELRQDFSGPEAQLLLPLVLRDQDKLADRIAKGLITDVGK